MPKMTPSDGPAGIRPSISQSGSSSGTMSASLVSVKRSRQLEDFASLRFLVNGLDLLVVDHDRTSTVRGRLAALQGLEIDARAVWVAAGLCVEAYAGDDDGILRGGVDVTAGATVAEEVSLEPTGAGKQ